MYSCDECEATLKSPQKLGGHKASKHRKKAACKFCDTKVCKSGLKRHEKNCKYNPKNEKKCKNQDCNKLIEDSKTFCGESCAAIHNNKKYPKRKPEGPPCERCGDSIKSSNKRFCSRECETKYKKELRFEQIEKEGKANFENVRNDTNEKWIKRFLIQKYGKKCMSCGWSKKESSRRKYSDRTSSQK